MTSPFVERARLLWTSVVAEAATLKTMTDQTFGYDAHTGTITPQDASVAHVEATIVGTHGAQGKRHLAAIKAHIFALHHHLMLCPILGAGTMSVVLYCDGPAFQCGP